MVCIYCFTLPETSDIVGGFEASDAAKFSSAFSTCCSGVKVAGLLQEKDTSKIGVNNAMSKQVLMNPI
jgi:hypothetical protein